MLCTGRPKPGKTLGKNTSGIMVIIKWGKKKIEDNSTGQTVHENCKNLYQAVNVWILMRMTQDDLTDDKADLTSHAGDDL